MTSTFGSATPSLTDMLRRNPAAVVRHFAWNLALTPGGIQLMLFNAAAGAENPDYFPAELHSRRALVLSLLLVAVLALGLGLIYRERRFWWEHWLRDRALGWLAMLALGTAAGPIILTQRPRPSYLFAQGIAIMALAGTSVFAISRRWPMLRRASRWVPLGMVALLFAVPTHYRVLAGGRPLLALYERLAPFGDAFNRSDSVFLVSGYRLEIHEYVGHNYFTSPLVSYDYSLLDALPAGDTLPRFLDREGINLFYVDEALWERLVQDPLHRSFLISPESDGWRVLAHETGPGGTWILLQKLPPPHAALRARSVLSLIGSLIGAPRHQPRPGA